MDDNNGVVESLGVIALFHDVSEMTIHMVLAEPNDWFDYRRTEEFADA